MWQDGTDQKLFKSEFWTRSCLKNVECLCNFRKQSNGGRIP